MRAHELERIMQKKTLIKELDYSSYTLKDKLLEKLSQFFSEL